MSKAALDGGTLGVWFPTVRTGTGTDVFTQRLTASLIDRGIRAEIAWLPHRAEYLPWSVPAPKPPGWAKVVHANSWLHHRFLPKGLPNVVTFHFCVHDDAYTPYKSATQSMYHNLWIKHCEKRAIKNASAITAVSGYTAERIRAVFGIDSITVVHNWVNTDLFRPPLRKRGSDKFRLLFVGNPSVRKGADLLPEIMRRLGPGYELRITAAAEGIPGYPSIPKNVIAVGRQEDESVLVGMYHNSDALLFPSRLEGFGLVALEAQACGVPVVATNGSSLPEVVEHGVTGLLCKQDDVNAFVEAIKKLAEDGASLRYKMTAIAPGIAASRFSESDLVEKYIGIYTRVAGMPEIN